MVSPPNKHGSTIYPLTQEGVIQAAEDGSAITYMTNAPTELEPKGAYSGFNSRCSRGAVGGGRRASRENIATPHNAATSCTPGYGIEYRFFSSDLSLALVEPQEVTRSRRCRRRRRNTRRTSALTRAAKRRQHVLRAAGDKRGRHGRARNSAGSGGLFGEVNSKAPPRI